MTTLRGSRDKPSLLRGIAATPDRVEALARDIDDATLDAAPVSEWSARTVLAHLRDDEFMVMRLRLLRMLVEENPTLTPFDEKGWAASRWKGRDALPELLADFRSQRQATMMILCRLDGDDWRRRGLQPEYGAFDVHWWVEHWLEHDETHIRQMDSALANARWKEA